MAAEIGFQKPLGRVCGQDPKTVIEYRVEVATGMYPGAAVIRGTTDGDISANDTSGNEIVGFLSFEHANATDKPNTIDTLYALEAKAPVIVSQDIPIRARLGLNQTITAGETLTTGATSTSGAGTLIEGTAGTDLIVAKALESVTTTSAVKNIWVQLI